MFKSLVLLLVCGAALSASNPAAGVPWRWIPRHPTVTPNVKALPYKKVIDSYVPKVRVPGTKAVPGCGRVPSQDRIVGGNEAVPHSYPWMVALFIDVIYFCGGSIINEEWILTAANCIDGASEVQIVAGAHNIGEDEPSQVTQVSTDFFVHEDFNSVLISNDIALIRVPTPYTWTDEIQPICLPAYSDVELVDGDLVNLSGWGLPSGDATMISYTLNEVTVPVLDNDICDDYYGPSITPDVICTDTTGGKGTCNGDSGGLLNYVDSIATFARGIVSFSSSSGCGSGYPDGYTRVLHYLDWIETNTGIAIDP